jgi:hypothetical protein
MKLLLTAAGFAAIIGFAVPAQADSADDAFTASLDKAGITYSDADTVVKAGQWVCTQISGGTGAPDVVSTLQSKNSDLSDDKANKFVAISTSAFCPYLASSPKATATSSS